MAPALFHALIEGAINARNTPDADVASLGPVRAGAAIVARDTSTTYDPGHGAVQYTDINNNALFALFGIIGAGIVVTIIWFFFWAKNGGFYFRQNDWDDYKSTVLRRKGPNGTILSGATPSTILGGGSIYKDVDDGTTEGDGTTVVSGTTDITGGVSDVAGREKRRRKRERKERDKERRREEKEREKEDRRTGRKSSRRHVGPDGALIDEQAEQEAKDHLRQYRHEKPARVGGINKESEGSSWDGSTNPSNSTVTGSRVSAPTEDTHSEVTELISHREKTPTSTPTKRERDQEREETREERRARKTGERSAGGIRKVYSTADKTAARESEHIRAEARRLAEKGRAAKRRDFSWQRGADDLSSSGLQRIEERTAVREGESSRAPGSYTGTESEVGTASDLGTKVYHHSVHIPVSSVGSDVSYAEEKRKKRGGAGYRRDRGE